MRALRVIAAAFLALALPAVPGSAIAGQCGAACATVCQTGGCDFDSPAACVLGVTDGSTCLVQGGTYHELVTYQTTPTPILRQDLVLRCADPANAPCVIDGDGERASAVEAYRNWTIEGFEIRNTTGDAFTSGNAGNAAGSVRDCWIHDVGGVGIRNVGAGNVVERNRVERTGSHGILCGTATGAATMVRNNLVVGASTSSGGRGISCTVAGSEVLHNTVDLRDTTSPWAGAAPYGIYAVTARYNVVAGGSAAALYATTACAANLAWAWDAGGSAFTGACATDATNVTGDPLFLTPEDRRPGAGSPAIGLAAASDQATDLNGRARTAPADAGAYEWADGDVAAPMAWPVREDVATPATQAAPAMVLLPGRGPMLAWFAIRSLSDGDLVVSERLPDGVWRSTILAAGSVIPGATSPNWFLQYVDLAVDPVTGRPFVAWVDRNASSQARLRVARFLGEECATGDCTDPRWDGCGDPALAVHNGAMAVAAAFPPDGAGPAVAAVREVTNGCGTGVSSYDVLFARQDAAGAWQTTTVEAAPCGSRVGLGVDLSFDPLTGAPALAWARSTGAYGTLAFAEDAGAGFAVQEVALGLGGGGTAYEKYNRVSLAHGPDGTLGIAFTLYTDVAPARNGFGYVQRDLAGWTSGATVVNGLPGPNSQRPYQGLDLSFDPDGAPWFVHALSGLMVLARRDAEGWDWQGVDTRDVTGLWARLAMDPSGGKCLSWQQDTSAKTVRFRAQADPGGLDLPRPDVCDDGDPCTISGCDPLRGCLHEPVDCDDGSLCTVDGCDRATGDCVNAPVDCGDDDRCTKDGCVPETGQCTHDPVSCDDRDPCTTDRCDGVVGCVNDPVDCDDEDPCTEDGCDPATGACVHDAAACDDGDACTIDTCRERFGCEHAPVDCDDADACTVDGCERATGCRHDDADCDDADACTADVCVRDTGCGHQAIDCDDGDICTTDGCEKLLGCFHDPVSCDDGEPCTDDSCSSSSGCRNVATSCDDGNACSVDTCVAGLGCRHARLDCDDADPCTTDDCDTATGCVNDPYTGPCDDGEAGTILDSCVLGVCVGVPAVVELPVIVERVGVRDVNRVTPPVVIAITERVGVREANVLTPPVVIRLVERVGVRDAPVLTPPVVIAITERIGVAMTGTGELGDPPPEPPPEIVEPVPDVVEPSPETVQPTDPGPDPARDPGVGDPGVRDPGTADPGSRDPGVPSDVPSARDTGPSRDKGGGPCSIARVAPSSGWMAVAILLSAMGLMAAFRKRRPLPAGTR